LEQQVTDLVGFLETLIFDLLMVQKSGEKTQFFRLVVSLSHEKKRGGFGKSPGGKIPGPKKSSRINPSSFTQQNDPTSAF